MFKLVSLRPALRHAVAFSLLVGATTVAMLPAAQADEAQIRKGLAERLPKLPVIDEVTKTAIPGIYEVRMGAEIVYSDEQGLHIFQGSLIDTTKRVDLTKERVEKLTAFDFKKLPLNDAIVWKTGSGARKMVVFSDPNCGYCKRLEGDIQKLKNVTVYTFLVPVLGEDSVAKSRDIWCAKNRTDTWLNWMLQAKTPVKAADSCTATPLERNLALARKHHVNGTPALVFSDSTRVGGAIDAAEMEKRLVDSGKS